jgi:hypothetical protein
MKNAYGSRGFSEKPPIHPIDIVREYPVFFSVLASFFIIQFDLMTGEDIEFPLLFAIPVAIAAWGLNLAFALGIAVVLPLLRVCFVIFFWKDSQAFHILLINAIITVSALVVYAYLTFKSTTYVRQLEARLKELEGKTGFTGPH